MSRPQVGDVVTTARELVALPYDAVVVDAAGIPRTRRRRDKYMGEGWTHAGRSPLSNAELADGRPMTVVYLPGQLPRPDRVVKAEALREWAREVRERYPEDIFIPPTRERLREVHEYLVSAGGTLDAFSAHIMRAAATSAECTADLTERSEP